MEERIAKIEKDIQLIKKRLRKEAKEREFSLKEKFRLHDHAQNLLHEFEEIHSKYHVFNPELLDKLKELVKALSKLVDNALGIKFP